MSEKECARCKRTLPSSEFRLNPKMRCGLNSWCKECSRESTRRWRREHREEINAARRRGRRRRHGGVLTRVEVDG